MKTCLAQHHSATSFLNSFLLEWDKVHFERGAFKIPLQDEELLIPVKKFSLVGRHHYEGKFYTKTLNHDLEEIAFPVMAEKIILYLSQQFGASSQITQVFLERLRNSIATVGDILQARESELCTLDINSMKFSAAEQLLFVGHNFHPTPKARSEFNSEDAKSYSPELKGRFPLVWYLAKKEIFSQKHSSSFQQTNWLHDQYKHEFPDSRIEEGFIPFPVHPWQRKTLLKNPSFCAYLEKGQLVEMGTSATQWLPTSSMRTLFNRDAQFMLKFSLNVKLTNSLRNLLAHELDRGLMLHEAYATQAGQELARSLPEFELIHEPVFAGLLDKNGELIAESLLLGRYNPFQEESQIGLLATLTMDQIEFKENLIHQCIQTRSHSNAKDLKSSSLDWFKAFLDVAISPLIIAGSNYGVLLGSHQQNMVLKLEHHLPVKSYFRDCNGTAFSHYGQKLFNAQGIILEHEPAAYLFGYYVIINSAFNVLSSIAHAGWCSEEELLQVFRQTLKDLKGSLKETYLVDYLLNSEYLMHKGNFLCTFRNINENTEENPLAIYTKIKNPLYLRNTL